MFLNNMKGCAIKANLLKSVGVLLLFAVIVKIVMLVVTQKKEDKKKDEKDKKDQARAQARRLLSLSAILRRPLPAPLSAVSVTAAARRSSPKWGPPPL